MRFLCSVLLALLALPALADPLPPGPFTEAACVDCHDKETPELTSQWRAGPHGAAPKVAECGACHGDRHTEALAKSRQNNACISCHGGPKTSVVRSYLTAKHGVIATIEERQWDFSQPLADGNYRAPTCAYCHFHESSHGQSGDDVAPDACSDCHSPRFVDTLREADDGAIAIGRLKVAEAAAAIDHARESLEPNQTAELDQMVEAMRTGPLRYLWHGLVHQSPDYQWWYGQAALDGDLLRVKAKLSRYLRARAVNRDR